jgi:hypothetical protein
LAQSGDQPAVSSELLDVQSGALTLRAQLWRPSGGGPFPAVLFNHGSYGTDDPLPSSEPETLGPVFARHGYVLLWLHRQAAREPTIRAAVIFGGAAGSWNQSAALRERLLSAVGSMSAPAFFTHAENDTQLPPGQRSPPRCSDWGNRTR